MPELKIKQMQYESDTWKRVLSFITDENVHLKNRLSEVLKYRFDNTLLSEIENFQSKFIKEDNLVCLLRSDIAELDKLLTKETLENGRLKKSIENKIKKLRRNIRNSEQQFAKLKLEFTSYLSKNI